MHIHNEQDIPIDIHCNKLLDWLVSRRHVDRDWASGILSIRQKINNAIQDMPEVEEIKELLAGSYINYFHCTRLVDLLKETEVKSKNIFGQYSSQRMKDWKEIVQLYEKNNTYLGEAAQMMTRNVSYEIPSLKRQILKCQQLQEECAKKEIEYEKQAIDFRERYSNSCRELGINGKNLRKELVDLLKDLPVAFSKISNHINSLREGRNFYQQFLKFTLESEEIASQCLPTLTYILTKGNTTVYEWKYGEPPEVIEETKAALPLDMNNGEESQEDQIDFGDGSEGIDFGDDNSSTTNGDFVHVEKIDYDDGEQAIEVVTPGSEISWEADASIVDLDSPGDAGKIAKGEDALSLFDFQRTRDMFLNDLRELDGFLEQRLSEMRSEGGILSTNQFTSASSGVQLQTSESISTMQQEVRSILSEMITTKMQHLYLIQGSDKYVDRLTDSLKQKLQLSEKMLLSQQVVAEKKKASLDEERILKPKLDLIVKKTQVLQKEIEEDISKRYKGRCVNIMGGVNTL